MPGHSRMPARRPQVVLQPKWVPAAATLQRLLILAETAGCRPSWQCDAYRTWPALSR